MKNLYIAYAATWIIHFCYVLYLWRKGAALQREVREFEREQQTTVRSQPLSS